MKKTALTHEFVEFIPDKLEDGTIYVSMKYATVAHRCCCGCGNEVVTPLSPTDWKLIFDGVSISLDPSIGNWGFDCRSHYWIRRNTVSWASEWSKEEIHAGRVLDRSVKEKYFDAPQTETNDASKHEPGTGEAKRSFWRKLTKWWQ